MKRYNITVNGKAYDVQVEELGAGAPAMPAAPAPAAAPAAPKPAAPAAPAAPVAGAGTKITAPMPGNILDVKVAVGDKVANGQLLLLLEAMKMENEIFSSAEGTVSSILVKKGDTVNSNDVLITIA